MAVTLATLRSRVLDRADFESSGFITEARLDEYINHGLAKLYDILVEAWEDYFYAVETITLVSGTEDYNLPSAFFKALRVYYLNASGVRSPMRKFSLDMLDRYGEEWTPASADGVYTMYRIIGNKIRFSPSPSGAGSVELYYIPKYTTMDGDDTDLTFTSPQEGWEEYAVIDAAIKCRIREESDVRDLMAERQDLEQKIRRAAEQRDAGEPDCIQDYYRLNVEPLRGPW